MGSPESFIPRKQFYAERLERIGSREVDFGVGWFPRGDRERAGRITWIAETGEIYVEYGNQIRLLGEVASEEEVEKVLEGWPRMCAQAGSLEWAVARISMAEDERQRLSMEEARRRRRGTDLARSFGSQR